MSNVTYAYAELGQMVVSKLIEDTIGSVIKDKVVDTETVSLIISHMIDGSTGWVLWLPCVTFIIGRSRTWAGYAGFILVYILSVIRTAVCSSDEKILHASACQSTASFHNYLLGLLLLMAITIRK